MFHIFCSRQYHHSNPFNTNVRLPEFTTTYRPNPVFPPAFTFQYHHEQRRHHVLQPNFSSCNVNIDLRTKFGLCNSDGGSNASTNSSPTQPTVNSTSRCSTPLDDSNDSRDRSDDNIDRMTPSPQPSSSSENGNYTLCTTMSCN